MNKVRTMTFLGFLLAIMPYLGFPYFFKNLIITVLGLYIAYIAGMTWYKKTQEKSTVSQIFENFSENKSFVENN